jgi:ribonuclease HII
MRCNLRFEKLLWARGIPLVAGVDEAGRGPLAGPVIAAAVIVPAGFCCRGINDSKQLTPLLREHYFAKLTAPGALVSYGIGLAEPAEIDRVNILQATYLAMQRAVLNLSIQPDHLLIDGLPVALFQIPQMAIVDGDTKSVSIAAASIIAKVTRDRMMQKWHTEFPQYGFQENKGYGTPAHIESLQIHGPCSIHRRSFTPVAQTYFRFDWAALRETPSPGGSS